MTKDEALKMAIDGLEIHQQDIIDACKEALEQPTTQEPVGITYRTCAGYIETDFNKEVSVGTSLYTHPKEWQGLSDEERYLNEGRSSEEIEFARAIEAKLKEKNTK